MSWDDINIEWLKPPSDLYKIWEEEIDKDDKLVSFCKQDYKKPVTIFDRSCSSWHNDWKSSFIEPIGRLFEDVNTIFFIQTNMSYPKLGGKVLEVQTKYGTFAIVRSWSKSYAQ